MAESAATDTPKPVVQLGEPKRRAQLQAELDDRLPALGERMRSFGGDANELSGQVFATRRLACEFVAEHPEITGPVQIDCMWADVLSPPVVDELLTAWPEAEFFNLNDYAAECVALVRERRDARFEFEIGPIVPRGTPVRSAGAGPWHAPTSTRRWTGPRSTWPTRSPSCRSSSAAASRHRFAG